MSARSTPPLFELLRGGAASPPRSPERIAPSPGSASPSTPVEPVRRSAWRSGDRLSVPWNAAFIAVACVLVLLIVAWAGGYSLGRAREKGEWERMGLSQSPQVREPQGGEPIVDDVEAQPERLARPSPTMPANPVRMAGGITAADPRAAGANYLKLAASVPEAEALGVLDFLAGHKVEAIAVAVEPGRVGANNPGRYDLYTLMGVGSAEFRSRARERDEHRDLLSKLGERWRREHRGTVDFARSHWDKHEG